MRKTKTYPAVSGPGASTDPVLPQNPERLALYIQNTGANPGVYRLGGPPQGSGQDPALTAGSREKWDQVDTCPLESVSVQSAAATTWVIMETIP